jgi:hypothetical protein
VVSLAVGCTEIKIDMVGLEVDDSIRLVDLLEIQRGSDSSSGLVKVMSAASLAHAHSLSGINGPTGQCRPSPPRPPSLPFPQTDACLLFCSLPWS